MARNKPLISFLKFGRQIFKSCNVVAATLGSAAAFKALHAVFGHCIIKRDFFSRADIPKRDEASSFDPTAGVTRMVGKFPRPSTGINMLARADLDRIARLSGGATARESENERSLRYVYFGKNSCSL